MWSIPTEWVVAGILAMFMAVSIGSIIVVLNWMKRKGNPKRRDEAFTEALRRIGQGMVIAAVIEAASGGIYSGLVFGFLGVAGMALLEYKVLEVKGEPEPDSWHV